MNISAIILTKNEEVNIAACLDGLRWCEEILVIDDSSTDQTVAIAKSYNARVYQHALANDFAMQRNFGLSKATCEWVFFVDADERISDVLRNEIQREIRSSNVVGFYLRREDSMWGKIFRHGEQGQGTFLRLAKRNGGQWIGKVHEVWKINGLTGKMQYPILHYPHPTVAAFLREINFYSTLRSKELFDLGVTSNWLDVFLFTKGKFVQGYILKMGFLDGMEGFLVALLMSFYSFLVRGKLWQLGKKS